MFTFRNVTFGYPEQGAPVLRGLNLQIAQGSLTALMGASASGKSTLAGLCNALLLPASGEVIVAGLDTGAPENREAIRRKVGLVRQNPDDQIVATIVEEDTAFGPGNLGLPPAEIRERVDEALHMAGIYALRTQPVHSLSGGQKQRVALAGVLALRPQAVILDESTVMLDPSGREEIFAAVRQLQQAYDLTVLWITHFVDEALQADRLVVLHEGRVALDGAPGDILSQADIRKYGLLPSPLGELMGLLADAGCPVSRNAFDAKTCGDQIYQLLAEKKRCQGDKCPTDQQSRDDQKFRERTSVTHLQERRTAAFVPSEPPADPARTEQPPQPILTLENVGYAYNTGAPCLQGIDLQVAPGETLLVAGTPGAGKSTLLQHLNGLLRPSSGKVLLEGRDIWPNKKVRREVRFQVGLAFQFPEYQLFAETVAEDIAFGPRNMGLSTEEVAERVEEARQFAELSRELLTRSPQALSAGEKRRAALAGVLAMRPEVLALDEPTAGLDPLTGRRIMERLHRYQLERNTALIIATHHIEEIAPWADRIVVLKAGRICLQGRVPDIFADPATADLTQPRILRLFADLTARGLPLTHGVTSPETAADHILALYQGCEPTAVLAPPRNHASTL